MKTQFRKRPNLRIILFLVCVLLISESVTNAQRGRRRNHPPTLGLEQGYIKLETPAFDMKLVKASQTLAALEPKGMHGFDYTPSDWLERRQSDSMYHLGDLTVSLRTGGSEEWTKYSSAYDRAPVEAIDVSNMKSVLAASRMAKTFPADLPLEVMRYWEIVDGELVLRFSLKNRIDKDVELGALGIPMVFNNILHERSLKEAHEKCSYYDPYIGNDAGYMQVIHLNGEGKVLLVLPEGDCPLEAYKPVLDDYTPRSYTFEGFYEWMPHSKAYAETEWSEAIPWNKATSTILKPGESRDYAVKFVLADAIRDIEQTLIEQKRPVAVGIPGYVLPQDIHAKLFLKYDSEVKSIEVEPKGALTFQEAESTKHGWKTYEVNGKTWGRARLTIRYADGLVQTVQYKVIKPEEEVVSDHGNFLTTRQWYENPEDPFDRHMSVISYDYGKMQQVVEDDRVWVAGLGDEGGSCSWLSAMMKQLVQPDEEELDKMLKFVHNTLWGGLQYSEGKRKYGVRKSLYYWEPDKMPEGTYSPDVRYRAGFPSWDKEQAESTGRSYNYPHVAAAYWVLYQLARNHDGLVTEESYDWYLQQAYHTAIAMVEQAPHYAQFGQMEGTIFFLILLDLQREGMDDLAASLEEVMRKRADLWKSLDYPFGSEMPWDSTGQEEVYAWCKYFGYDTKADVTLNAILAYMPTVPHWGYNGSARRFWDFLFAGDLRRFERQLHHYGSGLNAIPVLSEYRSNPDDFYLLRVGHGGLMGSISNITEDGFGPSAFHSFPSTLRIDYLSGDYGAGFFGYAVNTATYLYDHEEFGWLGFSGNVEEEGKWITVIPTTAARTRVYIASAGLWLTLDAGRFESVSYNTKTKEVKVKLEAASKYTTKARLRIDQPGKVEGVDQYKLKSKFDFERGAYVIALKDTIMEVSLKQ